MRDDACECVFGDKDASFSGVLIKGSGAMIFLWG